MKRFTVKVTDKDIRHYNELPSNTYFLSGFNNEKDAGKATLFAACSLIPIIDNTTGKQYQDTARAGQEIK